MRVGTHALSLRTRQNLRLAQALTQRGGVDVTDLIAAVLDGASLSAELLKDEVVTVCRAEVAPKSPTC